MLHLLCRGFVAVSIVLTVLAFGASAAQAKPRADWERGLLIASAAAPADLRSPTTALARVKAERIAIKRCTALLREAAAVLPMASGKTVALALGETLSSAPIGIIALKTDQGSDGSVVVTMALPIDRLRTLRFGPDRPTTALASEPIFVDARGSKLVPAVGLGVQGDGAAYHGPVLFFRDEAAARKGAGLGKDATLRKGKRMKQGIVKLEGAGALDVNNQPLVVVLYSEAP